MADFVAVLKKTLDGLGETTPATRARVYEKARGTISAKLAALNPPPPAAVIDRQRRALEEAINAVERDYASRAPAPDFSDPLAELENVFASLKNPQSKPLAGQPAPRSEARPSAAPKPDFFTQGAPRSAAPARPAEPLRRQAEPAPMMEYDDADDDRPQGMVGEDDVVVDDFAPRRMERAAAPRRSYGGLLAAAIVLAILAGGGYGLWLNKDAFGGLFGSSVDGEVAQNPAATPEPAAPDGDEAEEVAASTPAEPAPAPAETAAPAAGESKFTQRLTPDGSETDPGRAEASAGFGEGTSVAAATQTPEGSDPVAPAQPSEPGPEAAAPGTPTAPAPLAPATAAVPDPTALPVGQKAIFYEERTASAPGSAESGNIVWSLVQESPGANRPPEPAIRAEATIPGKDIQLRMTIRRNADQTLPASHIIEMIFLTPAGFEGGSIDNVLRVAMKGSEQEAGAPLIGIPAKIADGFFLIALNDVKADIDANMALLSRQDWIDVPLVYKTGRRALFTMEKGLPGEKVFADAMKAWQTPG